MARAPLEIPVIVKGMSDLDKLAKRMGVLEDEVKKLQGNLPKAANGIKKVGDASKGAARGVNTLSKAFKGLLGGLAVVGITKSILNIGDASAKSAAELQKLNIALRGVLGDDTKEGLIAIEKAAKDFNMPLVQAARNFTQLAAAGVENGNTVKELETLYRGLAAATKATGGSADDLNGSLRAATQVISKGKVQAEELRGQIGDRLPGAFQLFAQATNRTTAELQQALEDGTVSAEEFVTDFGKFIKDKYEPAAERIGDSPAEAGARLTKALEDLNRVIGPLLASIGAQFQDFATKVVKSLEPIAEWFNDFMGFLDNTEDGYVKALSKLAAIDKQIGLKEASILAATDQRTRTALQSDLDYLEKRRQKALKDVNQILANTPTAPLGGAKKEKQNLILEDDKKTKKSKSVKKLLGIEWDKLIGLEESRLQLEITEQQGQALVEGNIALYERLEFQRSLLRTELEIEALTKGIVEAEARVVKYAKDEVLLAQAQEQLQDLKNGKLERELDLRNKLATKGNETLKDDLDAANAFGRVVQEVKPLNKELTETEELLKGSFDIVSNGLVNGIQGLIQGTKEWGDILSDILGNLGNLFLNAAFSSLGAGLKIPGFADGGRPTPGKLSIVGERGPELFVPDGAGTVIPNDAFDAARGAMGSGGGGLDADSDAVLGGISNYYNQNGGASSSNSYTQAGGMGSSSERAFTQNSNSISNTNSLMRDRAIQREEKAIYDRAIEQNNQTTIGGSGSMVIQTQVINNVEYATVDQVAAASAASAKQARAQVFSDLKNKPSRRAAIGMR